MRINWLCGFSSLLTEAVYQGTGCEFLDRKMPWETAKDEGLDKTCESIWRIAHKVCQGAKSWGGPCRMTPNKSPKTCSNAYTDRSVYLKKTVMAFKMAYNFFFSHLLFFPLQHFTWLGAESRSYSRNLNMNHKGKSNETILFPKLLTRDWVGRGGKVDMSVALSAKSTGQSPEGQVCCLLI